MFFCCLFCLLAESEFDNALDKIHGDSSMLKYPSSIFSLPSEKIFVVDKDNLVSNCLLFEL